MHSAQTHTARSYGALHHGGSGGDPRPFRGLERSAPFPRPQDGPSRPGARIECELDCGPSAAAEARAVLTVLAGKADTNALEDVRLLISEVVTNAVRHARTPRGAKIRVAVSVVGAAIRAEVSDGGGGFEPAARSKARDDVGGWGLHLVDRLATRWGVDRGSVTRVWFEVDAA